ncbi:MAG: MMPL family transporter [Rhodospirillaceae bacterium]
MNTFIKVAAVRLFETSRTRAPSVLLLCLAVVGALGFAAATRLGMDTNLDHLLSAKEPWRQQELAFERAFPQRGEQLVAVVESDDADAADDGAAALAGALAARKDLFFAVVRPDADPYFRREGLLFLSPEEVSATAAQVIEAQPFIGSLAADPSLRGLFGTLNLALEGVSRGDATFSRLEKPLSAIADTLSSVLKGPARPLGWSSLLTGRQPRPEELRRFVLFKVERDFAELTSAEDAITAVHDIARALGLTADRGLRVRVTGEVAIENDEMATLASGAELTLGLSMGMVCLVLFAAVRSIRLIVPILITLVAGLVATAGFAALTVGTLNPISVAFAVLFVGLAVDFSIQLTVRYREERFLNADPALALEATARSMAGGVLLAALTTAVGFLAFLPTAYVGVSQLGLVAGAGMLIAVMLNFTLLPALLTLFRPHGEPASVGFARAAPFDDWLVRRRGRVMLAAALVAATGLGLTPWLRFDSNPMNLRDAHTESVAVTLDLMADPDTSPFTAEILVPDPLRVPALLARLEALPEVHRALALAVFVPEQQEQKLAVLEDVSLLLGPTLSPVTVAAPPDGPAVRQTLGATLEALRGQPGEPTARRLAGLLEQALGRGDAVLAPLTTALLSGLMPRLEALREALSATPVTLETLPDSLRRDWIGSGGQARIEVFPNGNAGDPATLARFVAAVRGVAPDATGPAVTTYESAQTIIRAFAEAGLIALVAIFLLLMVVLRRVGEVLLVLAPLALSMLMTVIAAVIIGLPLNFANVIALPLLLGIGVAFNIYFVMNWRRGQTRPLQSSTARAVLFSALTTTVAFGSLALSKHPGTASMGVLLTLSLAFTLLNTMLTLPALLAARPAHSGAEMSQPEGNESVNPQSPS